MYGKRMGDDHLWITDSGRPSRAKGPWEHGEGPLCARCGIPRGTVEWEAAADLHRQQTGHGLDTGACMEECGTGLDDLSGDVARAAVLLWREAG